MQGVVNSTIENLYSFSKRRKPKIICGSYYILRCDWWLITRFAKHDENWSPQVPRDHFFTRIFPKYLRLFFETSACFQFLAHHYVCWNRGSECQKQQTFFSIPSDLIITVRIYLPFFKYGGLQLSPIFLPKKSQRSFRWAYLETCSHLDYFSDQCMDETRPVWRIGIVDSSNFYLSVAQWFLSKICDVLYCIILHRNRPNVRTASDSAVAR